MGDSPDLQQCGVLVSYLHWVLLTIVGGSAAIIVKLASLYQQSKQEHMADIQTALSEARRQLNNG